MSESVNPGSVPHRSPVLRSARLPADASFYAALRQAWQAQNGPSGWVRDCKR